MKNENFLLFFDVVFNTIYTNPLKHIEKNVTKK